MYTENTIEPFDDVFPEWFTAFTIVKIVL